MYTLDDLNVIKSKDLGTQKAILDHLTDCFVQLNAPDLEAVSQYTQDDVLDLSKESQVQVIRYCLFAIYAADIATIPHQEGRERHLNRLQQIAGDYNLTYTKIIYLTQYADELLRALKDLGIS